MSKQMKELPTGLLHILKLRHDATEQEIKQTIKDYDRALYNKEDGSKDGMQLVTVGFEDDPRELADIPEAVALLRGFVRCGGLGLLVLAVWIEEIPNYIPPALPLGLGAMEVWAIAEGKVKGDRMEIEPREFRADYVESLKRYEALVG